ncbi:uncharacterized protein LOC18447763 isoform X3 [Amborella trichopoda]|uniref:uncharacterized protein LOC18447763 isoform X3 n=1 Tax=Amborella trichopoda TaxID=13333 RepID=UPI0009BCF56C|nr:uncharacterized protein LOC18447763 isoform X3 [Amborella trichopoda]|eukprot:XP_020531412.1 uncharacterized protein LOC18447763 isoform X3 [Amborella trichopoda]
MERLASSLFLNPNPKPNFYQFHFPGFNLKISGKSYLSIMKSWVSIKPFFCASNSRVSITPPPLDFDYRAETFTDTIDTVSERYPELLDLVESGNLVLVKKMERGNGEPEMIWVIATSHVSVESVMGVSRLVKAVKPENVVVELCRSRAGIMYAPMESGEVKASPKMNANVFSLSGSSFFAAVNRSLNLGGQSTLAFRLLLAAFSTKISSDIGRPLGNEFRAARKASEEVGAQIVLGDRPIEITLGRAWGALNWREKLRLVGVLLRGINAPSLGMSENTIEYLAWSLKRSKAVKNTKSVVGVIGKSHMKGVIYALVSDQGSLRFRDLVGKRPSNPNGWVNSLLKSLARDTVLGFIGWALYERLKSGL